jgi:hypothetical protein
MHEPHDPPVISVRATEVDSTQADAIRARLLAFGRSIQAEIARRLRASSFASETAAELAESVNVETLLELPAPHRLRGITLRIELNDTTPDGARRTVGSHGPDVDHGEQIRRLREDLSEVTLEALHYRNLLRQIRDEQLTEARRREVIDEMLGRPSGLARRPWVVPDGGQETHGEETPARTHHGEDQRG